MSAAPSDKPAEPTPTPPAKPRAAPSNPVGRVFLAVSAVLFFGWLGWLSYTALTKSREPIVSRAQAAGASVPVVATVELDEKGAPTTNATVVESLKANGPTAGTNLVVANLPTARGFTGEGKYLLLLAVEQHAFMPDGRPIFQLVGPRGAGPDEPPTIYPWAADVEAQARRLYRAKD